MDFVTERKGEPMDDLISRETMIDAIDSTTWYHQNRNKDIVEGASVKSAAWFKAEDVYKAIENLPTARPERKKGKYIGTEYDGYADGNPVYYEWKCSECGCIFEDEEPTYNFCPNCGADMRGEQDG